jgi:ankyrin repeat protein
MPHTRLSRTTAALALCMFVFHGCQQPGLNAREEDMEQTGPPARTPQAKLDIVASTMHKSPVSGLAMTSSSDSSPDAKHADPAALDFESTAQPIANVSQGNTLAPANADTTMTEASREVVRKRPATIQVGKQDEKLPATKHVEKETQSSSHKELFTLFADATERMEQDSEDEEAWDTIDQVLSEGAKYDFLTTPIMCPNDSNPTTEYEYTPLHYAAAKGLLELVKELVERWNVSVNIQTYNNKSTPLHLAASRGHLDVVEFLVNQGANPNITDGEGGSALHYAAAGRRGEMNRDVIEYLAGKSAALKESLKKSTKNGSSLLSAAVFAGNIAVVEYWVDTCSDDSAPEITTLTEKALRMAKYRKLKGDRGQEHIIRMLEEFLGTRAQHNTSNSSNK